MACAHKGLQREPQEGLMIILEIISQGPREAQGLYFPGGSGCLLALARPPNSLPRIEVTHYSQHIQAVPAELGACIPGCLPLSQSIKCESAPRKIVEDRVTPKGRLVHIQRLCLPRAGQNTITWPDGPEFGCTRAWTAETWRLPKPWSACVCVCNYNT